MNFKKQDRSGYQCSSLLTITINAKYENPIKKMINKKKTKIKNTKPAYLSTEIENYFLNCVINKVVFSQRNIFLLNNLHCIHR
jgi:hypothetical protein